MNKKYFIVGLGMIGASYAKKLSSLNYEVYGYDKLEQTNKKALSLGYIKDYGLRYLNESDLVILTLYPEDNYAFIKEHLTLFNKVKLVTDTSGVKEGLIEKIKKILLPTTKYLSHHPMAGSERSGIDAADSDVFIGANFLIVTQTTPEENSLKSLMKLKEDLGFSKASIITPKVHDLMISFTSQLPHMIAVALVNSDIFIETKDFSGDSYKDLTRIANINENLWKELFFSNKENLLNQMERFQSEFLKLIETLKNNDKEELMKNLINAKDKRRGYN